jgi:predicted Zn-dependent protease
MEVINNSKEKVPYKPIIGREIFLKKIDGMLYGDKPENGFFFKNKFIHKPLDFSFDFDEVFYFLNYPKFLIGNSENQAKIIFTIDKNSGQDDAKYFSKWGKVSSKKIKDLKKNELLNGFLVSSCIIEKSDKILKLALIKDNKLFYKFSLIVDREKFDNFAVKFDNTIKSFKKVSDNPSLKNLNPPTIKILSNNEDFNNVKSNSLVSKINLQKKYSKEIFSAINHTEKNNEKGFKKLKVIY